MNRKVLLLLTAIVLLSMSCKCSVDTGEFKPPSLPTPEPSELVSGPAPWERMSSKALICTVIAAFLAAALLGLGGSSSGKVGTTLIVLGVIVIVLGVVSALVL